MITREGPIYFNTLFCNYKLPIVMKDRVDTKNENGNGEIKGKKGQKWKKRKNYH